MNPNVPPQGYQPPAQFYQPPNPAAAQPMMGFLGNNPGATWLITILWFLTWILIIAVLFALLRWLWRKGEETRKR